MTYIELINNFWSLRRLYPMTSYEADFYFYLLKECNLRNWLNPFDLPTRNIEFELSISRKTICDLRNKLQEKGLIQFKEGNKRGGAASYRISYVSESNIKGNIKGNIRGNVKGNVKGNVSGNTYIKNKNKTETNIDNSNELFPEPKKKKTPSRKKEIIAPSLSEVKEYFSGKLEDWEQEAETFFYHFDSLGWRTANGARIERWDSRANLWIHEKLMRNGNRHTENNGGNSITVTDTNQTKQANSANTIAADLAEFIDSIPIG